MKKFAITLLFVLLGCGEPYTDVDDIDVESSEQGLFSYTAPYRIMSFPVDQGAWKGNGAGQIAYANPYASRFEEYVQYFQDDGKINLIMPVGWPASSCSLVTSSKVQCNGQVFTCPATAWLTLPTTWQIDAEAPNNSIVWGWTNGPDAPGNHGVWPPFETQASSGAPTIQFNPSGSGGTTLSCNYPMSGYWLRHF